MVLFLNSGSLVAQDKTYWSSGFEMLFSFPSPNEDHQVKQGAKNDGPDQ